MRHRTNARGCVGRQWGEREYTAPRQVRKVCRRLNGTTTFEAEVYWLGERLQHTARCTNCGANYLHTAVPPTGCLMCDLPWEVS